MKTVLITGASRGIGKATAEKFLQNGWTVYGTFYKSYENMKDMMAKYKTRFIPMGPYDFSNLKNTQNFINTAKQFKFDALFLNAGIFSENDDFLSFNLKDFQSVMNCNFYTPLMTAIELQHNINNNGSIILMSSNDAYSGAFASISYSASKEAIASVMKSLCVNYGKKGIRVNSIAPGAIDTDMNTPEQIYESPKWTPLKRVAQPYEVANVVYFLANSDSSFINGENITIDGGYSNISILLQKEMESNRVSGGYKELIERYNNAKKGETIYSFDVTDCGYAWTDTENEKAYLNSIIAASERGVIIKRFVITPQKDINKLKSSKLYQNFIQKLKKDSFCCMIAKEDLFKITPSVYQVMGQGADLYIKNNGQKSSFIDFYASDNNVGFLTSSTEITNQMSEAFAKLINAIQLKKVKAY